MARALAKAKARVGRAERPIATQGCGFDLCGGAWVIWSGRIDETMQRRAFPLRARRLFYVKACPIYSICAGQSFDAPNCEVKDAAGEDRCIWTSKKERRNIPAGDMGFCDF